MAKVVITTISLNYLSSQRGLHAARCERGTGLSFNTGINNNSCLKPRSAFAGNPSRVRNQLQSKATKHPASAHRGNPSPKWSGAEQSRG